MSLLLLSYILLLRPWLTWRTGRQLRVAPGQGYGALCAPRFLAFSLLVQVVLFLLAWRTGGEIGLIFAVPSLNWLNLSVSVMALAACLALLPIARRLHSVPERRRLIAHYLGSRSVWKLLLWGFTLLVAGIAEEAAYRGVGMSVLSDFIGIPGLAALICALAFAAAHAVQGPKSGVIAFGIALILHALVAFTESLLPAMLVHTALDFIALAFIGSEAKRLGVERGE